MEASETDHVEYRAPSTGTVQLKVELLGLLPAGDADEDEIKKLTLGEKMASLRMNLFGSRVIQGSVRICRQMMVPTTQVI